MSWFVFTRDELAQLDEDLQDELRATGRWTEHDTLLVNVEGPIAFRLTATTGKRPRRMARDPPLDTRPM